MLRDLILNAVKHLCGLKLCFAKRTEPGKRVTFRMKRVMTWPHLAAFLAFDTTNKGILFIGQHRHKDLHVMDGWKSAVYKKAA